jgi:hypothetical protein
MLQQRNLMWMICEDIYNNVFKLKKFNLFISSKNGVLNECNLKTNKTPKNRGFDTNIIALRWIIGKFWMFVWIGGHLESRKMLNGAKVVSHRFWIYIFVAFIWYQENKTYRQHLRVPPKMWISLPDYLDLNSRSTVDE